MTKQSVVKRSICLGICLILIIVACIVGYDWNRISAGAGGGSNAEIASLNSMGNMLEDFSPRLSGYDYNQLRYDTDGESEDEEQQKRKKYKSVTMYERTSVYANVTIDKGHREDFSTTTIQREMYIYITENATFYKSICTIASDAAVMGKNDEGEEKLKKSYSNTAIDMELYISKDRFLLRFNKLKTSVNGKSITGCDRIIGKWGDFSDDTSVGRAVVSALGAANNNNFRVLNIMGNYISSYIDDGFSKDGDSYVMKKDTFKSFASRLLSINGVSSSYLDDGFSGEFALDLGNAERPTISLEFRNEYEHERTDFNDQDIESSVSEFDVFEFYNINNTVISVPNDISTISAEKFDAIMQEITEDK